MGALTVHKAKGTTLINGIAVEITSRHHPWIKVSVIVIFSREKTASKTIIVHDGDIGATVVPVPAAVWLFSSGLIGMAGLLRLSQDK